MNMFFLTNRFCRFLFHDAFGRGSDFRRRSCNSNLFIALYSHHARVTELTTNCLRGLLADKVELGATNTRALHDFNRINNWRIERECLFYPDAGERCAYRKGRSSLLTVFDREYKTFKSLLTSIFNSLFFLVGTAALLKLNNILYDTHGIARAYPELSASLYIDRSYNFHTCRAL